MIGPARWIRSHGPEIALVAASLAASVGAAELAGRWLHAQETGLPFFHAAEERFYPSLYLGTRDQAKGTRILLLGGSVLQRIPTSVWRPVENDWRLHNVSFKAHTTLDSLYKLESLLRAGQRYDFVVLYHGINEVRTNNVPPELFAADYSHYAFYRMAHALFRDRASLGSLLARHSDIGYRLALAYHTRSGQEDLLPPDNPPKAWKPYGADIKSKESFRRNLIRISERVRESGARLIVPRFAYAAATNYSIAAWRQRSLGFSCATRGDPTHIWGIPEHVPLGIDAHNQVIDEERDRFVLVDTHAMQGNVDDFCDICHFSERGMREFVKLVLDATKRPERAHSARGGL
jgi:hypothetical protein